mgnify:CR=1 FL=1
MALCEGDVIDRVMLDLPEPWQVVPRTEHILVPGGLLVAFQADSLRELKKLCELQNESLTVIGSLQEAKEIYLEVM